LTHEPIGSRAGAGSIEKQIFAPGISAGRIQIAFLMLPRLGRENGANTRYTALLQQSE
jgi:hypothetical protein